MGDVKTTFGESPIRSDQLNPTGDRQMKILPKSGTVALFAFALLALSTTSVSAQEDPSSMAQCSATVSPTEIQAGNPAEKLSITLSSPVGEIDEFEAEDSNLSLSEASDLPRTELAAETEEPEPITMSETGNEVTVYVNSTEAEPGTYPFTLTGADGECQGSITVSP
jgi:hypothetical protein